MSFKSFMHYTRARRFTGTGGMAEMLEFKQPYLFTLTVQDLPCCLEHQSL